jgi:hypothetical protein
MAAAWQPSAVVQWGIPTLQGIRDSGGKIRGQTELTPIVANQNVGTVPSVPRFSNSLAAVDTV